MKVIVGLGNPGQEYENTRHNVGFMTVDLLAKELDLSFESSAKLSSLVAKNADVVLVKPQTFMNRSGEALQAVLQFYKAEPKDLIVVHDDLDIALGEYKIQNGTGPKGHNGLISIYSSLGTQNFFHVRIGVDGRENDRSIPGKAYVLQPFLPDEQAIVQKTITTVCHEILPRISLSPSEN